MNLEMAIVSVYLRRTRKPVWSDVDHFAKQLRAPKADPAPPRRLRSRHLVEESTVRGFRLFTVTPRAGATGRGVLYLHGGGYVNSIAPQHWALISKLADQGATVRVPLYGLAPQHTFTEAYELLDKVYDGLAADSDELVIMGDSAGGGLALGFAQTLRDAGRPLPRSLTLIAPWLDIACRNPEIDALEPLDPWLARPGAILAGQTWAAGTDRDNPRLSPVFGDMTGLPPLHVYCGTLDIVYPDVKVLARRAREAGVEVDLTIAEGACHVYPLVPTREGRRARERIVAMAAGADDQYKPS
ncbi:alpha/beta hydrolase fold domain-containing protein [Tomitella biformata]|uniref:alpha/beta hydrolase fold domain-containing protein n=1 Tax=Tomitella biformata TaxID=630403 RepID=UPI000464901B|nr:alpha/beta hydrolase [Tomitella biformata]